MSPTGVDRSLAARALRALHVSVIAPRVPTRGAIGHLVVANHLGFLDVLVLAAWRSLRFVTKPEVLDWPVLGPLGHRAGAIAIPRRPVRALRTAVDEMTAALAMGHDVCVFPEATTTVGTDVSTFHAACFEAAQRLGATIECCHLRFDVADGRDPTALTTWVGREWLLPKAMALVVAPPITATICRVASVVPTPSTSRRALAQQAHRAVAEWHATVSATARRKTPARVQAPSGGFGTVKT
ncbi:MAG: 1-acyl-sn-glycerol-3-phosphate acyltransferase [Gemmatimonadaceae bacterium]|nr:1-acyl-sn-glycerol-3-phosphate acyltransferase [Gemmatimonadaceae bacterium]